MSLSSQVKELEDILAAYGHLFSVIRTELKDRGFKEFDESVFLSRIDFFRTLKINKAFYHCPFPEDCKYYEKCIAANCNADICDNGFPRKGC